MITLVSYPRSGNTFLRNVLFEVYGMESTTYLTGGHGPDANWQSSEVVKTHHLPEELPPELQERAIVYLIRDGRDAAVSFAHHRQNIVAPESNYHQNLLEVVYAAEGSHFGGWSKHVESWLPKAEVVIRFEELIANPIACCERLRSVMTLPQPDVSKLPDFNQLKQGIPEYGSGKYTHSGSLAQHWFRRGKVGNWKLEMKQEVAFLFWHLHGETMEWAGYDENGAVGTLPSFQPTAEKKVLVEATKLSDGFVDGIGRYVQEMLRAASRYPSPKVSLDVLSDGQILGLDAAIENWIGATKDHVPVPKRLLKAVLKAVLPDALYQWLARHAPKLKRKKVKSEPTSSTRYDRVWLTLPQNARFFDGISFNASTATVHDLTHVIFPSLHQSNNVRLSEEGMEWIHRNNSSVIAVSQSTQRDLAAQGIESEVIPEGVDRRTFFPIHNRHLKDLIKRRYGLPSGKFILSVSTIEPRKNLQRLLTAYSELDESIRKEYPLVLAGRKGWRSKLTVPNACANQVHFIGYVKEDHLPALYTLAAGFCYVSLYEGFGLPVLEAMACGCPVLVSNKSSLPEIVGESGLLCDPDRTESIVKGLQELVGLNREEAARSAMRQSWKFTWRQSWESTARLLSMDNKG